MTDKHSKTPWEDKMKKDALKQMDEVRKLIQLGKLKVVSSGMWSSGIAGGTTFTINLKEVED